MSRMRDVLDAVGNTPMVRLARITEGLTTSVFAKLEMLNPGGSVKDRIATYILKEAERRGVLRRGGTVIEPTSGNTGVGLAQLAAVKGYRTIFTVPDKVSEEKRALLRAYGAEVVVCPTDVPPDSEEHYVNVAKRLARERRGSFMPNQYENAGNPRAHYETTGPEVWRQTKGRIDAFVAAVGTGGTISGVGRYLKEKDRRVVVVGVEPEGSIYHNRKHGTDFPIHSYAVEGIGEDFVPETYDEGVVDEVVRVTDEESFLMARRLAREEGILAGGSSGAAVAGCLRFVRMKRRRGRAPRSVVVLLPDTGRNYLGKVFSDDWMASHGYGVH